MRPGGSNRSTLVASSPVPREEKHPSRPGEGTAGGTCEAPASSYYGVGKGSATASLRLGAFIEDTDSEVGVTGPKRCSCLTRPKRLNASNRQSVNGARYSSFTMYVPCSVYPSLR